VIIGIGSRLSLSARANPHAVGANLAAMGTDLASPANDSRPLCPHHVLGRSPTEYGGQKNMLRKRFPYVLVLLSVALIVWATLGFVEYVQPTVAFGLQDANFPAGTQFLHWLLILTTGLLFTTGFISRWKHTPFATIVMYASLATLCFVQTVDFQAWGGGPYRFIPMATEFAAYIAFSMYLLRSKEIQVRFGRIA
jgi:hypothetical protein